MTPVGANGVEVDGVEVDGIEALGTDGVSALPRSNGELVFKAPWESRAFGMAAALADQQVFDWRDFQAGLIRSIGEWEAATDEPYEYYERWLTTLERLIAERDVVPAADLDERVAAYVKRPAGHDHGGARPEPGGHSHAHHDHDHP